MQTFSGSRGPFNGSPGVASSPAGNQAFTITADDAVLANMILNNYKAWSRQKSEDSYTSKRNPILRNIRGDNISRGWDTVEGQETFNALMENCHATTAERGLARWFSVKGGIIRGCSVVGVVGEPFFVGIHLEGQCENILVEDTEVRNAYGVQAGGSSYTQGDGYADEGGQPGIVYRNIRAIDCGDAGVDSKSKPRFVGVIHLENCGRALRLHRGADGAGATFVIVGARGRGIWMAGQTSQYPELPVMVAGRLIARNMANAASIIRFEDGAADLTISWYELDKSCRGVKLQENGAAGLGGAKYPGGGRVEQNDGSWITYPGAPPVDSEGRIL